MLLPYKAGPYLPIPYEKGKMGEYKPHGHQLMFHESRDCYFIRANICGTGSGKTLSGCAEALYYAATHENSVGYIFEPSYKMVKRILIANTLEKRWLLGRPLEANPMITDFRKGELRIDLFNGSIIYFQGLEDPERAEGPNIDFAMIDEARLIKKKLDVAIRVIRRRLRGSDPTRGYKPALWITTTPDAPGSTLYKFVEDPKTKHPKSRVFRWGVKQNIFLPKDFIDDVVSAHSGGLAERFIHGRFAAVAAGSFEFDYTLHVLDSVDQTRLTQIIYGVDFGWTNPSAIVAIGFDGDGRAYCLDEFYANRQSDEALIEECFRLQGTYGQGTFICDSTEPKTIDKMMRADPPLEIEGVTKESRIHAIGNKTGRADGIREIGSRFKLAGDGRYRLYIHKRCVNLISELQVYDAEVKENDHTVDALRYGLMHGNLKPIEAYWSPKGIMG